MEISAKKLANHLNRVCLGGTACRVVFQEDLAACSTDSEGCLLASLPALLDSPFLPYPVELDDPDSLADLAQLLSDHMPMTELSYDEADQSLNFAIQDVGLVTFRVRPQEAENAAGHRAWMQRVFSSFDSSPTATLPKGSIAWLLVLGLQAKGQMLTLEFNTEGASVMSTDRPGFLTPVSVAQPQSVRAGSTTVPADRLVAAAEQLSDAEECTLTLGDPDSGFTLSDGLAVYVVWPF